MSYSSKSDLGRWRKYLVGNLLKNLGEDNENMNISIVTLLRKKKRCTKPCYLSCCLSKTNVFSTGLTTVPRLANAPSREYTWMFDASVSRHASSSLIGSDSNSKDG